MVRVYRVPRAVAYRIRSVGRVRYQRYRITGTIAVLPLADGQVGKFLLPRPGEKVVYLSNQEMYWHIGEMDVSLPLVNGADGEIPEPWRMPNMFRGDGVR